MADIASLGTEPTEAPTSIPVPPHLISDGERISEEDMRAVGEADDDALIGSEVAGREAIAVLSKVPPKMALPGFRHDPRHRAFAAERKGFYPQCSRRLGGKDHARGIVDKALLN